jgi:2,4-dienoyl-CoA reductase-like NADH-dependent reductase (Old Yellow Enzyme family)
MKTLFEHTVIGGVKVKNQLVRSATLENSADEDGRYNRRMTTLYGELAEGGSGTIISGMVGVDENSRISPCMVKAYDDTFSERLGKPAALVHSHGSGLIVQIAHCGVKVPQTDCGGI